MPAKTILVTRYARDRLLACWLKETCAIDQIEQRPISREITLLQSPRPSSAFSGDSELCSHPYREWCPRMMRFYLSLTVAATAVLLVVLVWTAFTL